MVAATEVVGIMLMGVSLTLKRDAAIGIATHRQAHKPLRHLQHVKRQHTQFKHLTGVNLLMPDVNLRHPKATAHKHHAQEIYCLKSRKRNKAIANNLHHATSNLKKSLRNARASKKTHASRIQPTKLTISPKFPPNTTPNLNKNKRSSKKKSQLRLSRKSSILSFKYRG